MAFVNEQQFYSSFDPSEQVLKVAMLVWDTGALAWTKFGGSDPTAPTADVNVTNASLAVTGTFWQATQPVSGPITDAQLRASAVLTSKTKYVTRIIEASATVMYVGKALPGTATSAASWQISKWDGDIETMADGNANYDNVFDNYASLSYS